MIAKIVHSVALCAGVAAIATILALPSLADGGQDPLPPAPGCEWSSQYNACVDQQQICPQIGKLCQPTYPGSQTCNCR